MNSDQLPRARSDANQAIADYLRLPTAENGSRANKALQRLRHLSSRLAEARLRTEQHELADRLRRLTRSADDRG